MKILLVADLHYSLRQWDWVCDRADSFDLVVVAGDLLDIGSIVPIKAQILVVRKYLDRLAGRTPLLVSSGNHDIVTPAGGGEPDAGWLQQCRREEVKVDGDEFEKDGHFFSILPWWESPASAEEVEEQLARQQARRGDRPWIWIYHPPPQGSAVAWNGHADLGDTWLCHWIRRFRPNMVLGGHIHSAPFVARGSWLDVMDGCWVFNGGRQPGPVPTFTVINTAANHAIWISDEDARQAYLREPLVIEPVDDNHPPLHP